MRILNTGSEPAPIRECAFTCEVHLTTREYSDCTMSYAKKNFAGISPNARIRFSLIPRLYRGRRKKEPGTHRSRMHLIKLYMTYANRRCGRNDVCRYSSISDSVLTVALQGV